MLRILNFFRSLFYRKPAPAAHIYNSIGNKLFIIIDNPYSEKLFAASEIAERLMKSESFKEFVLGSLDLAEVLSKGKLNQEHENAVKNALSDLETVKRISYVNVYKNKNPFSKVVAYYDNGNTIFFNTRKIDSLSVERIASTLIHERLHHLGYRHSSAKDWMSAPYFVGDSAYHYLTYNE